MTRGQKPKIKTIPKNDVSSFALGLETELLNLLALRLKGKTQKQIADEWHLTEGAIQARERKILNQYEIWKLKRQIANYEYITNNS